MEIDQLIAEIPDHDIQQRFASLSQPGSR